MTRRGARSSVACRLRGWLSALAVALAWPSTLADPSAEALPKGGAACFAGDAACRNDAFTIAAALLAADNIAHVVWGRVVDAPGLPDALDERRVVAARFEVRRVRKPAAECPVPARRGTKDTRCHDVTPMPRFLTLRIPSDWFAWPATGTSRLVARRAGSHLARLAKLERDLAAGRIGEPEHGQRKARSEGLVREALAAGDAEGRPAGPGAVRLLEDRRMRVEVGVDYLFALGPERQGPDGPYHLPETPDVDADAEWHFFAGDELDDVDIGLRGVGNCLLVYRDWFAQPPAIDDCMVFARGMATYWRYNANMRRH